MSFPIERELFHQAPNWDVGSSGRGAELAVLLHHQARAEHRAVDNAGGETLRSALYLFSPHPPRKRNLAHGAVHSEEFTEQGAVPGPEHVLQQVRESGYRGGVHPGGCFYEAGGRFLFSWWLSPSPFQGTTLSNHRKIF